MISLEEIAHRELKRLPSIEVLIEEIIQPLLKEQMDSCLNLRPPLE